MKRILIQTIIKENNDFIIIENLNDNTKQYLKEHIKKSILDRYSYQPLEHIQEMIDEAVYFFEDDLQAINYIRDINYTIDEIFYQKLKEKYFDCSDDKICDWEDEFEKPKKDIKLNKFTLTDFIKIEFIDSLDLLARDFERTYKNNPFYENYKNGINATLDLHYKHKNKKIDESINIRETMVKLFTLEELCYDNITLKEDLTPLTQREVNIITAYVIITFNKILKSGLKETIANDFHINNNTPKTNQELLNNSYDVIINTMKELLNTDEIIDLLENEKLINNDLFTNGKKLSKVKTNNHYMSFLYKCNSVYAGNHVIVFQEFVEALISGYMQFLEFENKEQKIKSYKQDLEVLKRYNNSNENDKNIQELEDNISFLSISKPNQKFIPFKELSNRLEIDKNQISNYIKKILDSGTHKNTIKQNFDSLKTIPKEICISKF